MSLAGSANGVFVGTDGAASRASPDSLAGKKKCFFVFSENLISDPDSCTSIVLCVCVFFFKELCFDFFFILFLLYKILQLTVIPV